MNIVIAIAAVIILVMLVSGYISTSNDIAQTKVMVDEAWADVEVAVEKRMNKVMDSFNTAKNYASMEQKTLLQSIQYRKGMTPAELSEVNEKIDQLAAGMNVVYENYPELKADTLFAKVQEDIAESEEHLAAARRIYNNNVSRYNQKIVVFPASIVAQQKHYEKAEFFKATEAAKKGFHIPEA